MESLAQHPQSFLTQFAPLSDISRPLIGPDELWHSYYCWLCKINGFIPFRYSKRLNRYVDTTKGKSKIYEALSWACNLKEEEFVSQHTMYPLYEAINKNDATTFLLGPACALLARGNIWQQTLCCEICMEDSYKSFGRFIWRRSHQISPCFWCDLHQNCELKLVSNAAARSPSLVKNPATPSQQLLECWRSHRPIQHYFSVCRAFLNRTKPIPWGFFSCAVSKKARQMGFGYSKGRIRRLGTHIKKTFPKEWLSLIPRIPNSKTDLYASIDSIVFGRQFCTDRMLYPLVVSTLWEDLSEAIDMMKTCENAKSYLDFDDYGLDFNDLEDLEDLGDSFDEKRCDCMEKGLDHANNQAVYTDDSRPIFARRARLRSVP
ncbi:TniQ family protein [Variovorax ureilyticus]|uniref:TniQ family protein n=1 Tax=Variovorax ureilyticus TaxID=1836198 RepID=UPI003BF4F6F9